MSFYSIQDLEKLTISSCDYVIFGGSFDPIHEGHVNAIRHLLRFFTKVVIAVTRKNPYKPNTPAPSTLRRLFVYDVLRYENISVINNENGNIDCLLNTAHKSVIISELDYTFSQEVVSYYRSKLQGTLYWAVGEDIKNSVSSWKNWNELNVSMIVVPIDIELHSKNIREEHYKLHPAIRDNKLALDAYK